MKLKFPHILFPLLLLVHSIGPLFGDYPLISMTIRSRDPLYRQQQQDVEDWYSGRNEPPPLAIYRYIPRPSEDLFSVAAAFNLPYESLATLNGWDAPGLITTGEALLVPNLPGIFVPDNPRNTWEHKLAESRSGSDFLPVTLINDSVKGIYRFFPGEKFDAQERIRFLGSLFASPLPGCLITSPFGYRPDPFTGKLSFHPGIDLRAAVGTPVLAARDGEISETGTLEKYGYFVIISHDGSYESVYAHLDEIVVTEGTAVNAGDIIARSGNSGISTGPHLHFEIRKNGIPVNPAGLTALKEQ